MFQRQRAKLINVHLSEEDRFGDAPLCEAIIRTCQDLDIAGATVLKGLEGYGESAEIHRSHLLGHNLPIVLTVVDSAEKIDRLMIEMEKMVDTAVITVSNVEMIRISSPAAVE
ncbi:MAG TPA: DUF190 domain-containing protein [Bryobacteraceae bacterium]|nr:DUF190 domain-containing protein [Bryobacteraceae bacterium]